MSHLINIIIILTRLLFETVNFFHECIVFILKPQRQGCGPLKLIDTRLLWLQAKHEERQLVVVKEPTQTNAADGFTKALQTAKYLQRRNCLGMGYDNGDEAETSKRQALAEPWRWARVEAIHAIPHPVLIHMLMQQTYRTRKHGWSDLQSVAIGLSELRVRPWLTVKWCSAA